MRFPNLIALSSNSYVNVTGGQKRPSWELKSQFVLKESTTTFGIKNLTAYLYCSELCKSFDSNSYLGHERGS